MSDDTGYGKPPQHTRFRKGVSGNPKGRPKGSLNVSTVLWRQLRTKIEVEENGVRKTMTKIEAAMMQLVNKAVIGDLVAVRYLTSLVASLPPETLETKFCFSLHCSAVAPTVNTVGATAVCAEFDAD